MTDKPTAPLQTVLLYCAAIVFATLSIKDLVAARTWGVGLLLIPIVGLLLPPVRNWIHGKTGRVRLPLKSGVLNPC